MTHHLNKEVGATDTSQLIKKRPKRKRSHYTANHTAARALSIDDGALKGIANNEPFLFRISQNAILWHAARRVDFFFYALIAYYNTGLMPEQGRTFMQHGRGRTLNNKAITQACHSSFFCSFVDATQAVYSEEEQQKKPRSILSSSHFLHSLNATVELPVYVNQLDALLEKTYGGREKSLAIIQAVAQGTCDPIEGLRAFFILLSHLLNEIKVALENNPSSCAFSELREISADTKNMLFDVIMKGSFEKKWDANALLVQNEYIELLLRLTPAEKKACANNPADRETCYIEKCNALQKEILNNNVSIEYQPPSSLNKNAK